MTEAAADPRRIEWLPLDDLVPDPANPKAHDEDAIGASVNRFGMIDLIARDDRTGNIVSGHGRLKHLHAARTSGAEPPDGIRLTDDGTWLAPVIVGWSSEDELAAEAVFTHDADGMLDEFRQISGQDPSDYAPEYARKVTVFIRDADAIEDFRQRLGVSGDLGADLNYPLGWVPNDRRKRRDPSEEPST